MHSDYQGTEKVSIGNDQGLRILHSGSSNVHTPQSSFKMNDILHVPNIYTNLLSVHQFTKYNDCCFIFDSSSFIIQDRKSGKTLFRGLTSNGLYPFHSSVPSLHSTAFFGAKVSADVWQKRLGHPSSTILHKVLSNSKLSLGSLSTVNSFCEYCQYAKSSKLPFSLLKLLLLSH